MKTAQEIFQANQILTVAAAQQLKGKLIACTSAEYKANTPHVQIFTVGEIISEWDNAVNRAYPDQHGKYTQYENYQQYWASYMTDRQIDEQKTRLLLMSAEGKRQYVAHTKYGNYYSQPVFTGSDADREVYYIEVGNIETSKPAAIAGLDEAVINGYFESVEGRKFFNLYVSYDAKLNIKTGQCWSISHPNYKQIQLPEINQLLAEGLLTDHNYGK